MTTQRSWKKKSSFNEFFVTDNNPPDDAFEYESATLYLSTGFFHGDPQPNSNYFGTPFEQIQIFFHEAQHLRGASDFRPQDPNHNPIDVYAWYWTSLLVNYTSIAQGIAKLRSEYNREFARQTIQSIVLP